VTNASAVSGEHILKQAILSSGRFGLSCEVCFWRNEDDAKKLWMKPFAPEAIAADHVVLVVTSRASAGNDQESTTDLLSLFSFLARLLMLGFVTSERPWTVLDLDAPSENMSRFAKGILLAWREAGGDYIAARFKQDLVKKVPVQTLKWLINPPSDEATPLLSHDGHGVKASAPQALLHFLSERVRDLRGNHHTSANLLSPVLLRNVFRQSPQGARRLEAAQWDTDLVVDDLFAGLYTSLVGLNFQWLDDDLQVALTSCRKTYGKLMPADCVKPVQLRVVLVDDDQRRGYSSFVSSACERLQEQEPELLWKLDRQDCFSEMSNDALTATKHADIVMLDLRLWHKEARDIEETASGSESERTEVLRKWRKLATESAEALGTADDIFAPLLEEISAGGKENAVNLAFWPRMLSSICPSLPIIIFSSTQQRAVVHAVRDLPNVLTGFSKPYFHTDDADARDPVFSARRLLEEMVRAAELAHINRVWRRAANIDSKKLMFGKSLDRLALGPGVPVTAFHEWLRGTWIPAMQRTNFKLAQALPWLFVEGAVRVQRIDKLREHACVETRDLLVLIERLRALAFVPAQLGDASQGRLDESQKSEYFARALLGGFALCQLFELE